MTFLPPMNQCLTLKERSITMVAVEFQKTFLEGNLAGITVVERINTDCPEEYWPGALREEAITGNLYRIVKVIVDGVVVPWE